MSLLREKLKANQKLNDEQRKKMMLSVAQKEDEVILNVTLSSEHMYPYFAQLFGDMLNSRAIIATMFSSWRRVIAPYEFVMRMNNYMTLFLKKYNQKDLLNEIQELKFFKRANVPGLRATSANYKDVEEINLETWRKMYLTRVSDLNANVSSDSLNVVDFWLSLKDGEFFHQWFRYLIITLVLRSSIHRFIPWINLHVDDVFDTRQFSETVKTNQNHFIIHYGYWASREHQCFAYGFNAPLDVLYYVLMQKESDLFVQFFFKTIEKFTDVQKDYFPDYPSEATVKNTYGQLPPNTIFFSEKQSSHRLFD